MRDHQRRERDRAGEQRVVEHRHLDHHAAHAGGRERGDLERGVRARARCRRSTASSISRWSSSATTSRAKIGIEYRHMSRGLSDSPWPSRSKVMTRCPAVRERRAQAARACGSGRADPASAPGCGFPRRRSRSESSLPGVLEARHAEAILAARAACGHRAIRIDAHRAARGVLRQSPALLVKVAYPKRSRRVSAAWRSCPRSPRSSSTPDSRC